MSEFDSDDDIEPTDFSDNNFVLMDEDFLEITIDRCKTLAWVHHIPVMYCENNDKIYNVYFDDQTVQRIRITPNQWHDWLQIVPIVDSLLEQKILRKYNVRN